MPDRVRFFMVGGFLGAGKTTTLARLAAKYRSEGQNVGIVTNDQAAGLVDTALLRSQGHQVGEVAGACFCCSFNDLRQTIGQLSESERPDVILAEPVGSCTDLVATVAQPLMQLYGDAFEVGPYAVILKPSHGRRILENEAHGGFSPKAEYIFRKQLEEADLILLNRVDELSNVEVDRLESLVTEAFPGRPVLRVSAATGEGFDRLEAALEADGDHCRRILDLDYDTYAEGEAELGWLNANAVFTANSPLELDTLLLRLCDQIQTAMPVGAEIAHLKAIGLCDGAYAVANTVSSEDQTRLSLASGATTRRAEIVLNARIATDPAELRAVVERLIPQLAAELATSAEITALESFRPGRPVPTHRYSRDGVDTAQASA